MKLNFKTLTLSLAMLVLQSNVIASVDGQPIGPNINLTNASNQNTIFARDSNPAWLGNYQKKDGNYGAGLDLNFYLEESQMESFIDDLEDGMDAIDNKGTDGIDNAVATTEKMIKDINTAFGNNKDAFLSIKASISIPIVLESSKLYGGWSIKQSTHLVGKFNALQTAPGTFDGKVALEKLVADAEAKILANAAQDLIDLTQQLGRAPSAQELKDHTTKKYMPDTEDILDEITTNAGFGLMYGKSSELAIGYGRRVDNLLKIKLAKKQKIKAGVRLKILKSSYNQSIIGIDEYMRASAKGDDVGDKMKDDVKDLEEDHNDTTIGIDIGGQFQTDKYQAGAILRNLNSPSIPIHNTSNSATGFGAVADKEIELKPQLSIDGAYYMTKNKMFVLAGSLDLNKTENLSNDESQWIKLGASYNVPKKSAWYYSFVPDVRTSYSKNMAGSKMSLIGFGLTFGVLNLDLATGKDDDKQAYSGSLGLEFFF